jgi:hypothetical protein
MTKYQEHIIADPQKVMIDYSLFSFCEHVPVRLDACDRGFAPSIELPTKGTLKYLDALKKQNDAFRSLPLNRTIAYASNGCYWLVLLPTNDIVVSRGFTFALTPDIRRSLVKKIKEFANSR